MRVVTISESQSFLIDLLETVREEGLILQTIDGQQFMLFSLQDWQGFDVGKSESFEEEVKTTSENKELIEFLAKRRHEKERVSMADVKKQLDLS